MNYLEIGSAFTTYLTRLLNKESLTNIHNSSNNESDLIEFIKNNKDFIRAQLMNYDQKALNLDYCNTCIKTISKYLV